MTRNGISKQLEQLDHKIRAIADPEIKEVQKTL